VTTSLLGPKGWTNTDSVPSTNRAANAATATAGPDVGTVPGPLEVAAGSTWRYVSQRSAVIAWQTNLPASSFVEFGETNQYGRKTALPERHFYLHLHYLKGLEPGTTYHCRLAAIDERKNTLLSKDVTFTTNVMAEAVRIPGDIPICGDWNGDGEESPA